MKPAEISVILPTYNESKNIPELLTRLQKTLKGRKYEIIVVDDNSPDRTWEIAEKFASETENIRVIRRIRERGLSSAVMTGMSIANGKTLAVMDSDLQHDEAVLPKLVDAILKDKNDIAIGSRGVEGGSYGSFSKRRRFISWAAASLAKMLLPIAVNDPMSGFFVVSRKLYRECAANINPLGFKILLEFIGRNPDAKTIEIGYKFRLRIHGETKLSGSVIRNYLIALYDIRFGKYISSTFLQYAFVGSVGIAVNLGGLFLGNLIGLGTIETGLAAIGPLLLAVPFGIELSIISNYFMNNYITFYEFRHKGFLQNIKGLVLFHLISMLGFVIQWGVFQLLYTNGYLKDSLNDVARQYVTNLIGIAVALATNYYLNINFTWNRKS